MAEHGTVEYTTATGNDLPTHEQTYLNFVRLMKYCLGAIIVILILMATFLT